MATSGTFVEHWEDPDDGASDEICDFVNVIP